MFMAFIIVPNQEDDLNCPISAMEFPVSFIYMGINFGYALSAGAVLAFINHRRSLHFGREEGMSLWKKALDLAIIGFMTNFIAIWTVTCSVPLC